MKEDRAISELAFHPAAEVETPVERAHRRAAALKSSFADVLTTLADIYRDEDWRHLTDRDGAPYTGFTAFVQDHLGGSASNARRYQQGITGLILPLQALTAEGTHMPVTSADVARLGQAGAKAVVDEAPAVLSGIADPAAQTSALRELIDRVAARPLAHHDSLDPAVPALGQLVPATIPATIPDKPSVATIAGGLGAGKSDSASHEPEPRAPDVLGVPAAAERESAPLPVAFAATSVSVDGYNTDIDVGDSSHEDAWEQGQVQRPQRDGSATAAVFAQTATSDRFASTSNAASFADTADADPGELSDAIATVLRFDPVAAARVASPTQRATLASDAVTAAHRLSRLGQLLQSLATSPGGHAPSPDPSNRKFAL